MPDIQILQATTLFDRLPSVQIIAVSYDDESALRKSLEEHEIEVVISALSAASAEAFERQIKLIRACANSSSVKRFAPSEWLLDWENNDEYAAVSNAYY